MLSLAEYIWLDGVKPTNTLRSKTRVVQIKDNKPATLNDFPKWGFDGSSTSQADGHQSDLALIPVSFVPDPLRGEGNFLVMCEVHNQDGTPHSSDTRSILRNVLENGGAKQDPTFGFEQEYTLLGMDGRPLEWPELGYPGPQGPYYCGVGANHVKGRSLIEEHLFACLDAGLLIYGINSEVLLSQWEFQIGYRGFEGDVVDALTVTDHMWYARYLIQRLAEDHGVIVSFENKPVKGQWNGTGCHTNFSTNDIRDAKKGKKAIDDAIKALEGKHKEHIKIYGDKNDERLTGEYETSSMSKFSYGATDRGCSIRIPLQVLEKGYGYLEDRRPGGNIDPYIVAARMIVTICGLDEKLLG